MDAHRLRELAGIPLLEAVKVKGAKTETFTTLTEKDLAVAMEKVFGCSMNKFEYGDELLVYHGVKALPGKNTVQGLKFSDVLKDPKELGVDFFFQLEDFAIGSAAIEFALAALIAVGSLPPGNFIVFIGR